VRSPTGSAAGDSSALRGRNASPAKE
jgi:hypothetical protein